jgi:hypothetical protein
MRRVIRCPSLIRNTIAAVERLAEQKQATLMSSSSDDMPRTPQPPNVDGAAEKDIPAINLMEKIRPAEYPRTRKNLAAA